MHFLSAIIIICVSSSWCVSSTFQNPACKPLSVEFTQPNLILECSYKSTDKNGSIKNNCSMTQAHGTIAKFYCKEHYVPTSRRRGYVYVQEKYSEIWCNSNGEWEDLKELEDFRCREECGKLLSKARPLIINGELSYRNFFPWHATLYKELKPGTWTYVCGASLIRNQILLTAAHCFTLDRNVNVDISKYRVILGSTSSNYTENLKEEEGIEIHEIQRLYVSDNYDPRKGFQADIAVIQLKELVRFSEFISPVCLPNDFTTDVNAIKNGETGLVAGFGVTEDGKLSKVLRSAKIKVQTNSECQRSLKRVLPESQFCAGENIDDNWITLCNGDSGGGFLFLSKVHEKYFLHGIVSSGDRSKGLKHCKNYSVFSRIYSFIFWILDVIEEINGEIARDLLDNVEYPYAIRGTEANYAQFTKLPREWENRITSLELEYVTISPEELISALEYARPLTSIKLSHIRFTNKNFLESKTNANRVILPVLDSFYLDIVSDDFDLTNFKNNGFIQSLIFFDKDYETTWNFNTLLHLGVNIDLQIHVFRLLHINHEKGEIFMNQIPTQIATQIFSSLQSDKNEFKLQTIALHQSNLEWEKFVYSAQFPKVSNIILDEVYVNTNFANFIQSTEIRTLCLNPSNQVTIDLTQLPKTLEHLALSKAIRIISNQNQKQSFLKMTKFCCDNCNFELEILNSLEEIMPSVETLYLNAQNPDISNMLRMKSLRTFVTSSINNGKVVKQKFERRSEKDNWKVSVPTEIELSKLNFDCFRKDYFWTNEEDYRVKLRLKSNERKALQSGRYEFIGTKSLKTNYPEFPGIPPALQKSLKHIKLQNVDIDPFILAGSISRAGNIESINFVDVVIDSKNLRYGKLIGRDVTYLFKQIVLPNGTVEFLEEHENGKLIGIILPFQGIGRFRQNHHANSLHKIILGLNSYYVDWNTTIHYMLDVTYGEIRSLCGYFVGMFGQLEKDSELRQITHSITRLYNTVVDGVLPRDWKFSGFQLITEEMINGFYQDNALKVFGRLGILEIMLKKYGHLITIESSPNYENLKNPINFPPIQAIAAAYNYERLE